MKQPLDKAQAELQDQCSNLVQHINLLRDFATTPGNGWLAKDELEKINQITAEIDRILNKLG